MIILISATLVLIETIAVWVNDKLFEVSVKSAKDEDETILFYFVKLVGIKTYH